MSTATLHPHPNSRILFTHFDAHQRRTQNSISELQSRTNLLRQDLLRHQQPNSDTLTNINETLHLIIDAALLSAANSASIHASNRVLQLAGYLCSLGTDTSNAVVEHAVLRSNALKDSVRVRACYLLSCCTGACAESCVLVYEALLSRVTDKAQCVRLAALQACGALDYNHGNTEVASVSRSVRMLQNAVIGSSKGDSSHACRAAAVMALGSMLRSNGGLEHVLEALIVRVRDCKEKVRVGAIQALSLVTDKTIWERQDIVRRVLQYGLNSRCSNTKDAAQNLMLTTLLKNIYSFRPLPLLESVAESNSDIDLLVATELVNLTSDAQHRRKVAHWSYAEDQAFLKSILSSTNWSEKEDGLPSCAEAVLLRARCSTEDHDDDELLDVHTLCNWLRLAYRSKDNDIIEHLSYVLIHGANLREAGGKVQCLDLLRDVLSDSDIHKRHAPLHICEMFKAWEKNEDNDCLEDVRTVLSYALQGGNVRALSAILEFCSSNEHAYKLALDEDEHTRIVALLLDNDEEEYNDLSAIEHDNNTVVLMKALGFYSLYCTLHQYDAHEHDISACLTELHETIIDEETSDCVRCAALVAYSDVRFSIATLMGKGEEECNDMFTLLEEWLEDERLQCAAVERSISILLLSSASMHPKAKNLLTALLHIYFTMGGEIVTPSHQHIQQTLAVFFPVFGKKLTLTTSDDNKTSSQTDTIISSIVPPLIMKMCDAEPNDIVRAVHYLAELLCLKKWSCAVAYAFVENMLSSHRQYSQETMRAMCKLLGDIISFDDLSPSKEEECNKVEYVKNLMGLHDNLTQMEEILRSEDRMAVRLIRKCFKVVQEVVDMYACDDSRGETATDNGGAEEDVNENEDDSDDSNSCLEDDSEDFESDDGSDYD